MTPAPKIRGPVDPARLAVLARRARAAEAELPLRIETRGVRHVPVYSDRGEKWADAKAAARELGVSYGTVKHTIFRGAVCRGRRLGRERFGKVRV